MGAGRHAMVDLFRCSGVVNGWLRQHWADLSFRGFRLCDYHSSSPASRPLVDAVGQPGAM